MGAEQGVPGMVHPAPEGGKTDDGALRRGGCRDGRKIDPDLPAPESTRSRGFFAPFCDKLCRVWYNKTVF